MAKGQKHKVHKLDSHSNKSAMEQRSDALGAAQQHLEGHLIGMDEEYAGPVGPVHEDDDFEMERYAFSWVASKKSEMANPTSFEMITPKEIIREYGVPRYVMQEHIQGEIVEAGACKSCIFILMLVICYSCMVINHFDLKTLRAVEDSLQLVLQDKADFFDGSTDFTDTREYADVWSFLGVGVLGLIFPESSDVVARSDNFGDYYPGLTEYSNNSRGIIGSYNRVVGGVRLRQERQKIAACGVGGVRGEDLSSVDAGIEEEIGKGFVHDCRGNRDRWWMEEPELNDRSFYPDEDLTVWLWGHEPIDSIRQKLGVMETDLWMNFGTSKVEVGIPTYNDEFGTHTYTTVIFTFSPGGQVFAQLSSQSCYYSLYLSKMSFWFDGIYFLFLCNIILGEITQAIQTMHEQASCRGFFSNYMDIYNLCDWTAVITGGGLVVFWIRTMDVTTQLNAAAEAVGLLKLTDNYGDADEVIKYTSHLQETVELVGIIQRYAAVFPLILVFRLFMAFHGQPRLALVTKTMIQASSDMIHFGVLMMATFVCFVVSGHIFFGKNVDEYSSMTKSMISCVRLLLGDIDFGEAADTDRTVVAVFIFLFCSFCTILLMNILISIILAAYANVKHATGNAETVWQETKQLIGRSRDQLKGKFCKHEVCLKALDLKDAEIKRLKKKQAEEKAEKEPDNDSDDGLDKQKKKALTKKLGSNETDVEESFQTSPSRKDGDPDSPDSPPMPFSPGSSRPPADSRNTGATRVWFDTNPEVQAVGTDTGNRDTVYCASTVVPPTNSFTLTDKKGTTCFFEKEEAGRNNFIEKVNIGLVSYTARDAFEHKSWKTTLLKEQDLIDYVAALAPPSFGRPACLTPDQAHEMMVEAVKEHYESHKHNGDYTTVMTLAAQINERTMAVGNFGIFGDQKEVSVKKKKREDKFYGGLTDVVLEVVTFIDDIQADRLKGQHKLASLRDDVQVLRNLINISDEELLACEIGNGKEKNEGVRRLLDKESSELYAPNGDLMPQDDNPPPPGVTESTRTEDYIRLLQAHGLLSLDHVEPPNRSVLLSEAGDTLLGPMSLGKESFESSHRSMNPDAAARKDSRESGYSSMSGTDMSGTDVEGIPEERSRLTHGAGGEVEGFPTTRPPRPTSTTGASGREVPSTRPINVRKPEPRSL